MTELEIVGIAKGGDGVARESSGRVVFVRGGLPGDIVDVELIEERPRLARAVVSGVLRPGPGRVSPVCSHVADGCGGCDLQHASVDHQRELKLVIVADALERIGRLPDVDLGWGGSVPRDGYRTTVRCVVAEGRAGFRAHRSDRGVPAPTCTVAHPTVRSIMADTDFGCASEVQIRVGARTGDVNMVATPTAPHPPGDVVGADELDRGREVFVYEEAAGRRWRVSARSFFQSSPEAVDLLASQVCDRLGGIPSSATVCDLYAGVGIFSGALAHEGRTVVVESSRSAIADAAHNLADLSLTLVRASVEQWTPVAADVVVADPPRSGLGKRGVAVVDATDADRVVLVSCDPAAFARDARLLVDLGFALDDVTVLDLFPQTSHVEVVAGFVRR